MSENDDIKVDEIYNGGSIKVNTPVQKKKPTESNEKLFKEVGLLNKQYNKLLVETNTLRKKFSHQEYSFKNLKDENTRLKNRNRALEIEINHIMEDMKLIKMKLGINK